VEFWLCRNFFSPLRFTQPGWCLFAISCGSFPCFGALGVVLLVRRNRTPARECIGRLLCRWAGGVVRLEVFPGASPLVCVGGAGVFLCTLATWGTAVPGSVFVFSGRRQPNRSTFPAGTPQSRYLRSRISILERDILVSIASISQYVERAPGR
jgi:hypothetical protein